MTNSFGSIKRTIEEEVDGITELIKNMDIDIVSGLVYWAKPRPKVVVGMEAGGKNNKGYHQIKFNGKYYKRHRIIFYVANGYLPLIVDHKHGIEYGDGIDNLQEVTNSENVAKGSMRKDNTSGYKGVSFHKGIGKYQVSIQGNYIGCYSDLSKAKDAYAHYALKLYSDKVIKNNNLFARMV